MNVDTSKAKISKPDRLKLRPASTSKQSTITHEEARGWMLVRAVSTTTEYNSHAQKNYQNSARLIRKGKLRVRTPSHTKITRYTHQHTKTCLPNFPVAKYAHCLTSYPTQSPSLPMVLYPGLRCPIFRSGTACELRTAKYTTHHARRKSPLSRTHPASTYVVVGIVNNHAYTYSG